MFFFASIYLPQHSINEIYDFENFLSQIDNFDYDYVFICGDFNACHESWGGTSNNCRGNKLYNILLPTNFSTILMPDCTRVGNSSQRDTTIDFMISNCSHNFSNVTVGPQISDHKICSCTFNVSNNESVPQRKRIIDFRRSWDIHKDKILNAFNSFDYDPLFVDHTLDSVANNFDNFITGIWSDLGIIKYVDKFSRPWFTPVVKNFRRLMRFWEKKIKKLKKSDDDSVEVEGKSYALYQLFDVYNFYRDSYFSQISTIKNDCLNYTNRLLDKNLHTTVKKLYKNCNSSIPTLRILDQAGKVVDRASDDSSRAKYFNQQFLSNTVHGDFSDDERDFEFFSLDNFDDKMAPYEFDSSGYLTTSLDIGKVLVDESMFNEIQDFSSCQVITNSANYDIFDNININDDFFTLNEVYHCRVNLKKHVGSIGVNNDMIRKLPLGKLDFSL